MRQFKNVSPFTIRLIQQKGLLAISNSQLELGKIFNRAHTEEGYCCWSPFEGSNLKCDTPQLFLRVEKYNYLKLKLWYKGGSFKES